MRPCGILYPLPVFCDEAREEAPVKDSFYVPVRLHVWPSWRTKKFEFTGCGIL